MAKIILNDGKVLEDYGTPYVVAEVNSSHNGNIEVARQMIKAAKDAGCDCVKFQSWSAESLYSKTYYDKNPITKRIVTKFSLSQDELLEMAKYCKELGIGFSSTPYSEPEVDFLADECEVPFIKIASMEVNNYPFLTYIAKKKLPIVLSTGMAEIEEVKKAVQVIEEAGNKQICLLHCISIYPADPETINLNNIKMLRDLFPDYPIGFSDHTLGWEIACAAVAMGSALIEKHITLDKTKMGMDNNMAIEPDEMKALSGKPEFLEVVRNKYDEKLQNLAQAYDILKRQQAVFQNDAQSKAEQSQSYLAKSKAFRNGASKVSKDWELGLDFGGSEEIAAPQIAGNDIRFAGQGDIGKNGAGAYGNFSNPKNEAPATSTPNTTTQETPAATSGASGKGNLVFKNGRVIKSSVPKSDSNFEEGSAERDFENLANEYYKIGRFGVGGAWQNLDTQVQRRALDDNWLRKINGVKQKLALDLRNNPESFAKHRPLFDFIRSGNQFGDTNKLLESAANPPQSYDLSYYANQFNATGDEVERGDLQDYLAILNEGGALTMPEVKHLEKMLKELFPVTNLKGEKKPLLQQNGLKIKFFKATNEDGSPMLDGKEQLYFVPLKDSFK